MNCLRTTCFTIAFLTLVCAPRAEEKTLAFPGAKGFGIETRAGWDGALVRVTNLRADGPGSLRHALETKGARVVIFEVGGVIDLARRSLSITEPYLTIAGQSAPSPGITLIRGGVSIATHDVLIQHICVRPGDAEQERRSGWEPDGIATNAAYNIVIDHCSITWAVDENLSASGERTKGPEATSRRVTFSNCIIAEGLDNSSHAKGKHSKGSLVHDFCRDIAIIGNLYANNIDRNPYFKAYTTGVIVNNLIYNPGSSAIKLSYVPSEWKDSPLEPENGRVSIVGNVLVHGPDTRKGLALTGPRGDAFLEDNLIVAPGGSPAPTTSGDVRILKEKPAWPEGLEALPASETADHVLRHAGARPRDRDAIDRRIVQDFRLRRGRVIDSQNDVGGYPNPKLTSRKLNPPQGETIRKWLARLAAELE